MDSRLASKLLGVKICAENNRDERVCIYANLRGDKKVYLKVTVDGEKVAHVAVEPLELLRLAGVAVLAEALDSDEIEEMWSAVKGGAKVKRRAEKARRRRRDEDEEEEGEEEERVEEEEEEELEFA